MKDKEPIYSYEIRLIHPDGVSENYPINMLPDYDKQRKKRQTDHINHRGIRVFKQQTKNGITIKNDIDDGGSVFISNENIKHVIDALLWWNLECIYDKQNSLTGKNER